MIASNSLAKTRKVVLLPHLYTIAIGADRGGPAHSHQFMQSLAFSCLNSSCNFWRSNDWNFIRLYNL